MPHLKFDRDKLVIKKLAERENQLALETSLVPLTFNPERLSGPDKELIQHTAQKIISSRNQNRAVILAFGAHTIKNGLSLILIELIKRGWVTHLATNGAGIIHDWEFAFQAKSGENVRENVKNGQFGIWEETGFFINLALVAGAWEGLGYGESIGKMISQEGLKIPGLSRLLNDADEKIATDPGRAAAAIDLSGVIRKYNLKPGFLSIPHPWKRYSVQSAAFELNIPFTGHPMFGHDIIYTHPLNNGAATGRTALNDFLYYAQSVSNLEHG
ncbi:MAG: hypothetical protein WAL29_10975, partial [Bacteroidales bacterium]